MENRKLDKKYLATLKVLYVEDDEDTRKQISQFLRRAVGTLITAENGAEGVEAFTSHSPDIIVTDIMMPEMDGLAMARAIRQISSKVPIIALTAFEQTDYMRSAINIGFSMYVIKPVNSEQLLEGLFVCASRLREEMQSKRLHTARHGK